MLNILKTAFLSTVFVTFLPSNSMELSSIESSPVQLALVSAGLVTAGIGIYCCWSNENKRDLATQELQSLLEQSLDNPTEDRIQAIIGAIKRGADIPLHIDSDDMKYLWNTPLHLAAKCNHAELAELLIEKKADIRAVNFLGDTPMTEAMYSLESVQNIDVIKLFLVNGYPINKKNCLNEIALHHAIQSHKSQVAEFLLEQGSDINTQDQWGSTPLHKAVTLRCAKVLLANGANFDITNRRGETALGSALISRKKEIIGAIKNKQKEIQQKNITQLAHAARDICDLDELGLGEFVAGYAAPKLEECSFALSQKLNALSALKE